MKTFSILLANSGAILAAGIPGDLMTGPFTPVILAPVRKNYINAAWAAFPPDQFGRCSGIVVACTADEMKVDLEAPIRGDHLEHLKVAVDLAKFWGCHVARFECRTLRRMKVKLGSDPVTEAAAALGSALDTFRASTDNDLTSFVGDLRLSKMLPVKVILGDETFRTLDPYSKEGFHLLWEVNKRRDIYLPDEQHANVVEDEKDEV